MMLIINIVKYVSIISNSIFFIHFSSIVKPSSHRYVKCNKLALAVVKNELKEGEKDGAVERNQFLIE